jgi:hypothetical protein
MSQHDYNIANGGGAAVRADINNALLAILSQNSGATAPTTTKPFMTWYDTTTGLLKMRNAADTAWVDALAGISGGNGLGMVNRIINGAMIIDQRNYGASVANIAGSVWGVDRWRMYATQATKFTLQQNAGSVTPPAGFKNYLGLTVTNAYSVGASDEFLLLQSIEGLNIADLAWGTASASPVTLSFWVRSSLTGTFGGTLQNDAQNQTYPFTFVINSANTWEQKTLNIAGATAGTWDLGTAKGIRVCFSMGSGSSAVATAGAWNSGGASGATGQTQVVATAGATFQLVGVDLRKGTFTSAPAWDWRPYGTELALCHRYCVTLGNESNYQRLGWVLGSSGTTAIAQVALPVVMRAIPSISYNTLSKFAVGTFAGGNFALTASSLDSAASSTKNLNVNLTVASGLTGGSIYTLNSNGVSDALLTISSEL